MADGSTDAQHSEYYKLYKKRLPLNTLILRSNRITDIGASKLIEVLLNVSKVCNGAHHTQVRYHICTTVHTTPIAKYVYNLTPDTGAPPVNTYYSKELNAYGIKRPVKKFYPRNILKAPKVTPIPSVNTPVTIPLPVCSTESDGYATSVNKIKSALLGPISRINSSTHMGSVNPSSTTSFYLK